MTNDGEVKSLGQTPIELNGTDVFSNASRMSMLQVSKEGYETNHIFIAQDSQQENYNILTKLKTKSEDVKSQDLKNRQEKLARTIASAQNLTSKKKFSEAERLLTSLTQDFPHVSVTYDLLGNIAYLQRDLKAALNYYQKSFALNPENSETQKMIDKLKGMTN